MPSTYAELKLQVLNFLNDLAAEQTIDTFIDLAEADMSRRVRHWRMEKRATAQIDTQYSGIPSDFLEPIRFYLTDDGTLPLELISQMEMLQYRANSQDTSGKPRYYAITAGEFEVAPTPDGTYNAELYYYSEIAPLSDSNTSNWLLQYYPDAYLYGTLLHSAPYLKEDVRLQTWASLYEGAIAAMNAESDQTKFNSAGRRIKIRSY